MKHSILFITLFLFAFQSVNSQQKTFQPIPSDKPSKGQFEQIKRKYGMFIHFGINTFHNEEWTDGSKPVESYKPDTINADQWVLTAKNAGMKYVILVCKHHEGFCLWDSKYTTYDVASTSNKTNVVEAVAKACKKHKIELGLYYSLWDRKVNGNVRDSLQDVSYNQYMIHQLKELFAITKKITPVVEFWFDGSWVKQNYRWNVNEIYQTIKQAEPNCQVGINWSIGFPNNIDKTAHPYHQKAGFPIRYFPTDFRLGDPDLPSNPDPKTFTHDGKQYYMPWETTVCMSNKWFYHTEDTTYKSMDELVKLYNRATAQDNILIINCPPNRAGVMRNRDAALLVELRQELNIK